MINCIQISILLVLLTCSMVSPVSANDIFLEDYLFSDDLPSGSLPGDQPPGWSDNTENPQANAALSYHTTDGLGVIDLLSNTSTGYVTSMTTTFQIQKNTMLEYTISELTNCTISVQLHFTGDSSVLFPPSAIRTRVDQPGTYTHNIFNLISIEGTYNFQIRVTITGQPSAQALLDSIRIYPYQPVFESDGSYLEHFNWQINQTEAGWTAGDGNSSIRGNGESNGVIRLRTNIVNQNYGDVISPILSNFDTVKHHTLEIKVDHISPGAFLEVQIQAAGNQSNQYLVFDEPIETPQIKYARIDNQDRYSHFVTKLWLNGTPGISEASIDYLRIYAKPTFTATATVTATPLPVFPQGGHPIKNPYIPNHNPNLEFAIDDEGKPLEIKIMNLYGRPVVTVHKTGNGYHWDGKDKHGHPCEGGVYIYQIHGKDKRISGKIVLIR